MNKINCPNCGAENMTNARYCGRCGHLLPEVKTMSKVDPVRKSKREAEDRRLKSIVIVVGILLFCLVGYSFVQFALKPAIKSKVMEMKAAEINKSCPVMVDEYTRLDSACVMPENKFQYNYTLMQLDASQINADTIKKYLEPGIIEQVKMSPELKVYRDHKMTMVYYYRDQSGVTIFNISVTPDMYE